MEIQWEMSSMKKNFMMSFLMCLVIATMFVKPISVRAEEKNVPINFTRNHDNITLTIKLESAGEYSGAVISPTGDAYECTLVDASTLTCSIDKVTAGDWMLNISDDTQDVIPKVTVTMSEKKSTETDVVDSKNITVGKDIVGLKTYFVDDSVVIEWTDDTIGNVSIQIVDLDTNETLANASTSEKRFVCDLKETTKKISVNIVPATSSGVTGATTTYTYDVNNHPEATVSFDTENTINKDTVPVTVTSSETYTALAYVDDSEVISNKPIVKGENSFEIPIAEDGFHTVTFYVVDSNGNMRSTSKTLTKDSIAPELKLDAEYDNLETTDSSCTISGNVTGQTIFTVNDVEVKPTSDGTFSYDVTLHDGSNSIVLCAKDNAGNETSYNITLNKVAPKNNFNMKQVLVYIIVGVVLFVILFSDKKKKGKRKKTTKTDNEKDILNNLKLPDNVNNENNEEYEKLTKPKKHTLNLVHMPLKKIRENKAETSDTSSNTDLKLDLSNEKEKSSEAKTASAFAKAGKARVKKSDSDFSKKELIPYIVIVAVFAIILNFVISIGSIKSGSMENTVMTGDIVIGNKLAYVAREPQRGDIIFFKHDKQVFCKRVIGVAGDEIAFSDGYVYVNSERIDESAYLGEDIETNCTDTFIVPNDCVFVLGDNRENSHDSRFFDSPYISKKDIVSKILVDINGLFR